MSITREQICAFKAGDVVCLKAQCGLDWYMVILEREGAKVVFSLDFSDFKEIAPIRNLQWEHLEIDDSGEICDSYGTNVTETFLGGEVLEMRAQEVANEYRSRVMPSSKIVHDEIRPGAIAFCFDRERLPEINKISERISEMVFNNDYGGNQAVMAEMFTRLVAKRDQAELPFYVVCLIESLRAFGCTQAYIGRQKEVVSVLKEVLSSRGGDATSQEAQDLMNRVSGKKPS